MLATRFRGDISICPLPSTESLLKMYDACRFEKALNVSALSAWCAAFSRDELMTIEYREDLLQDSRNRRERQINRNARCNPLGEMFSHFRWVGCSMR